MGELAHHLDVAQRQRRVQAPVVQSISESIGWSRSGCRE
jgi:hypothetical protein